MADQETANARYDQAREAFNDLNLEERLTFMVKEFVNTVGDAVEKVVDVVQRECSMAFSTADDSATEEDQPAEESSEEE